MSKRLQKYMEGLVGGHSYNVVHYLHKADGSDTDESVIVMFVVDAEFDPICIEFDIEGCARIYTDGNEWHQLTPDQLRFIADKGEEAKARWDEILAAEAS